MWLVNFKTDGELLTEKVDGRYRYDGTNDELFEVTRVDKEFRHYSVVLTGHDGNQTFVNSDYQLCVIEFVTT